MSIKKFYKEVGLKDNPFPMSGVTPAEEIGKLEFLEPIGVDEEIKMILKDFKRHIRNDQSAGYSFVGDYGQGKSLLLHHLHKLFIKTRENISDTKDNIIIGYVRGKTLSLEFKDNTLEKDILSIIIRSLEDNSGTMKDSIKDEFLSIIDLGFKEKTKKFNEFVKKHDIARFFIFVDEVEDIRKYSPALETYRDLVDVIPKITLYLFCTNDAWERFIDENPAIVKEDLGLGRIKECYLPLFTYDIAIESVNSMIEKAKINKTTFSNPFREGLIRSICLCSQFNGRVFSRICNLLLHNYIEDLKKNPDRIKLILPNEFLNEEFFSQIKVDKETSHLFDFEIYHAILNSIRDPIHKELFKFFLAYYQDFTFDDVKEYVKILEKNNPDFADVAETKLMEFLFERIDILKNDLRLLNIIASVHFDLIDTHEKFKDNLTGIWTNHRYFKKNRANINVPTFELLSLDDMKYIFGMGNNDYSIPIEKFDDISIMINSANRGVSFESRKSEQLIRFLKAKNCIETMEKYRISEYIIYKIFQRHTPLGFNPWNLILDENHQENLKQWYNDKLGKKELFKFTSVGVLKTFQRLKEIYPDNFQMYPIDNNNYHKVENFSYVIFKYTNKYLSGSKFITSYISNSQIIIEELLESLNNNYKIPNCFIFVIDDEPTLLEDFYKYLHHKKLIDSTMFEDRTTFFQIDPDMAILLFLIGLFNLENYQMSFFKTKISFDEDKLGENITTIANNFEIKLKEFLDSWKSKQEKNGLYLKSMNTVDEDRFLGGMLPSIEMLNTISIERSLTDIDVKKEKDFFLFERNPLFRGESFYQKTKYIGGIPQIIGNLSQTNRMDLTVQEGNIFRIKPSNFELYLVNLFKKLEGITANIYFKDLLEIFNFENFSKEYILKFYLSSLAYKGIITILDNDMHEIVIRKKEFVTKIFNIIKLKEPILTFYSKRANISKKVEQIESIKKLQCKHGVKVEDLISTSDPILNDLNSRYTLLKQKSNIYFKLICGFDLNDLKDSDIIQEELIKKNLGVDPVNNEHYLFRYPVLFWNNYYLDEITDTIKDQIDEVYTSCKVTHNSLDELENEIESAKTTFENCDNKLNEIKENIKLKKIEEEE